MPPNTPSLPLDTILQHHQTEIDKNKDNYHKLDKNILALHSEFKKTQELTRQELLNICNKIDELGDNQKKLESAVENRLAKTDERIDALEAFHNNRQWWLNAILKILKSLGKLWWLWILVGVCFFAFDLEFKVKNPHLVSMLVQVVQRKL
jgi:septal ring factor EnvC (AmiA/AmiB activator)